MVLVVAVVILAIRRSFFAVSRHFISATNNPQFHFLTHYSSLTAFHCKYKCPSQENSQISGIQSH